MAAIATASGLRRRDLARQASEARGLVIEDGQTDDLDVEALRGFAHALLVELAVLPPCRCQEEDAVVAELLPTSFPEHQ